MSRYLVISADCHAGLPNAQYRDWLEPRYHDEFDAYLADRVRMMELAARGMINQEFAEEWAEENEEGLRGGWDAIRRDLELDADGVAGEVLFPDADAVAGRRLRALRGRVERVGRTRARTGHGRGPGPQPLAGRAVRHQPRPPGRGGAGADPRRHRRGRSRDRPGP